MKVWLEDLKDIESPSVEEEEPQTDLFNNDDDDNDVNNNQCNNTNTSELLQTLIRHMSTASHLNKYPAFLDSLTVDSMTKSNSGFATFYSEPRWAPLHPLVKLVFSASGSSASTPPIVLNMFI